MSSNYRQMPKGMEKYSLPPLAGKFRSIKLFRDIYLHHKNTLIIILKDKVDSPGEAYKTYSEEVNAMNRGLDAFVKYITASPGSEKILAQLKKDEKAAYYFRFATIDCIKGTEGVFKTGSMLRLPSRP